MTASLNEKLRTVKWGEYKLGDIFEVVSYKKRFDAYKVCVYETGRYPYIVRMGTNNGQKGYINEDTKYLNDGNTISFGQDTATVFYQEKPYFTGDKIKILKPKFHEFCKNNAQFFIAVMNLAFRSFSWGSSSFNMEIIKDVKLTLPSTPDGRIDFTFIESFIAELEAERVAELEAERVAELSAYLAVSGLDNYELSKEEQSALELYETRSFEKFDLTSIFDVKNTSNLLSEQIVENSGKIPYLCASAENNGVSSYIDYDKRYLEKGRCVFIGGKTFVVSYQQEDFFSNDSHNLALYPRDYSANKSEFLYLVTCVRKSLSHKYSWGDSVSKTKIKTDKITLPARNGNPDYEAMELLISAIQKLVIKDVINYADNRIKATKKIISGQSNIF